MIVPTVGRMVWYWPIGDESRDPQAQPHAAQVAYVWSSHCVNLSIISHDGVQYSRDSVLLYQGDGERPTSPFCEWMPFQIQTAKQQSAGG